MCLYEERNERNELLPERLVNPLASITQYTVDTPRELQNNSYLCLTMPVITQKNIYEVCKYQSNVFQMLNVESSPLVR